MFVRNSKILGSALRQRRKDLELTQQTAADRAQVSRLWLSKVENGHDTAQFEELNRLVRSLDLTFALEPQPPISEGLAKFTTAGKASDG